MRIDDQNETNFFEMSDEEVMGMTSPPAPKAAAAEEKTPEQLEAERLAAEQAAAAEATAAQATADQAAADEAARLKAEQDAAAATAAAAAAAGDPNAAKVDEQGNPLAAADDATVTDPTKQKPAAEAKPGDAKDKAPAQPAADSPEAIAAAAAEAAKNKDKTTPPAFDPKTATPDDHKSFFEKILGQPIKANGKDFQVRSPEEAERLIQMGLNYTKKMQAWQPRMRVVTMLENNGLMDEAKLSHLIDLSKGDPLAIQKLLADSKFDPMTVDADKAASYKPGSHQVSDAEMAFNAALDDLESSDTGVELITEVSKQWDEQSRQAVFQNPDILRTINEQKQLGLYARIVTEMDHLKTLGHLQGVPFLQAYKAVGDMLHDQGRLNPNAAPKQPEEPVETRVATPAPKVANAAKAAAASPTKASPAAVKTEQNFLDLPDDQFLKQMQGRV